MNEVERPRRRFSLLAIVGIAVFSGVVILVATNRTNVKAGLNTPIRYDDFVFQVNPDISSAPRQTMNKHLLLKSAPDWPRNGREAHTHPLTPSQGTFLKTSFRTPQPLPAARLG